MADTAQSARLLLVDDDEVFGDTLARALSRRGYAVDLARSVADGRKRIEAGPPEFAIIDLRIHDDTGLTLVELLAHAAPDARVIVLTGFGSIATAVEAIKLGATQYLTKPASVDEILTALEAETGPDAAAARERPLSVRRLEWEHIQKVLAEHNGNISATARALGMHRRTLQRKLQKRPVKE